MAQLYKLIGQKQKAETAYDQILSKEKDNLAALVNKAMIRSEQGDEKTAKVLFVQAEQAAPGSLKAKSRAISDNTLSSPSEASQAK